MWDFVQSKCRTRMSHDTSEKASFPASPQPTHIAIPYLNSFIKTRQVRRFFTRRCSRLPVPKHFRDTLDETFGDAI